MAKTIAAIFEHYSNAENAAREIRDRNLGAEDISIVARHDDEKSWGTQATMNTKDRAKNDNISDGVMTGGILGGLAGLLIGAGSMAVPGLGIVAAAGPITGLLSGAVTGGIVGGLIDLGIPEDKGKQYETDIKAGKILFSMKVDNDRIDQVAEILRNNHAESVDTY
jgi:uncharacterized membrane protein